MRSARPVPARLSTRCGSWRKRRASAPCWTCSRYRGRRAPGGQRPMVTNSLPLARFNVLDLTRARAGPTCVRQLVDWGATAIKIEMPGGRAGDGMGGNRHGFDFQNLHRNKKAIKLNLRDPEGVEIFKWLAKNADIVVENY